MSSTYHVIRRLKKLKKISSSKIDTPTYEVILICSENNALSSHIRGGSHDGTHTWGLSLMWEEGALLLEHLSLSPNYKVILTCSGSNAPSSHMRGGPHGETHTWGPPLMWEEEALLHTIHQNRETFSFELGKTINQRTTHMSSMFWMVFDKIH